MTTHPRLLLACLLIIGVPAATHMKAQDAVLAPPTPAAVPPAAETAAVPVRVERFVDRVWRVEASPTVAPGTRYVFLGDNVLIVSADGGSPAVGTWAEDADGLVTTLGTVSSRATILESTPERFRLRVAAPKLTTELTLVPAIPAAAPATDTAGATTPPPAAATPKTPLGSPYRCGADAFRVAFEGDTAYIAWPDDTVLVLTETKVPDAPASRRTYTDGKVRLVEDTSEAYTRVLFARAGFRPRPCTPTR